MQYNHFVLDFWEWRHAGDILSKFGANLRIVLGNLVQYLKWWLRAIHDVSDRPHKIQKIICIDQIPDVAVFGLICHQQVSVHLVHQLWSDPAQGHVHLVWCHIVIVLKRGSGKLLSCRNMTKNKFKLNDLLDNLAFSDIMLKSEKNVLITLQKFTRLWLM